MDGQHQARQVPEADAAGFRLTSRSALGFTVALCCGSLLAGCAMTPLTRAAIDGDVGGLQNLIADGADLEVVDSNGETALMKTAITGQVDAARALLDAGAQPNHKTFFGTPLSYAVQFKHARLAALLLERGATPTPEAQALAARAVSAPAATRTPPGNLDDAAYSRMRASAGMPPENKEIASDVDAPSRRGSERPNDFALLIGIEDYQSLPKADFGARDAKTVRRHFEALGVPARNVIALEGAQATGSKMRSYLQQWLPRNVKPESTVFVYYSGHGAPDPETGDAYLVPWDADPMFLTTSAYPLKQFYAELAKLKAKRVVVALDACFSGSGGRSVLAKGARPLVAKVDESVPAAANLTVLAAASGSEITGTLDDQAHGIFTYHFLKGLSGGAKTPRALYDYLKPRVQDDARRQNREQSPTLTGSSDAAF